MKARGLGVALIALVGGCAAPGAGDPNAFRIDQMELTAGGAPYLLRGELGRLAAPDAAEAALAALPEIAQALRVPAADLVTLGGASRDEIGMTHVHLAQQKNGLRVVGGAVTLHIAADGVVRAVTSSARDRALDAAPALAAADAARLAVQATSGGARTAASELVYVISSGDHELYLAWEIEVVGQGGALVDDLVYVDALTGRVVDRHPQIFPSRVRTIYDGQGQTYPTNGIQIGTEASPPTDTIGLAAYDNTGTTYDCYQALYQRDSYDGLGAGLTSLVHVVFPILGGGTDPNNAVWVQTMHQMAYGDGDGTFMAPLARALDVTAHELTHGVTAATANLVYQNESGALNEAMSDIMGAVCESWRDQGISARTWLVGEEIFTPATDGDALRYMADPAADAALYPPSVGGSRDYYPDLYKGSSDNGGVHINSGIPNLAFSLLVTGGQHPRGKTTLTVPGIGIDKAGRIFYRALTQGYFGPDTGFIQARAITELVAQDLYGAATKSAVTLAWAAVGVGPPPPSDVTPPTVKIVSPTSGSFVKPGFQVEVSASDDKGVRKVELLLDGLSVGRLTAPPYTIAITDQLATRSYTLSAVAYDEFNYASDSVMITVEPACEPGSSCDPGAGNGDTGDGGGGCCSTGGSRGGPGSLLLVLATAWALRRPRRRR